MQLCGLLTPVGANIVLGLFLKNSLTPAWERRSLSLWLLGPLTPNLELFLNVLLALHICGSVKGL